MLIQINTDDLETKMIEGICQRIKDANVIKQLAETDNVQLAIKLADNQFADPDTLGALFLKFIKCEQLAINLACNSQTSLRTRCEIAGLYANNYNVMSALCEADETTLEVLWDVFNCTQSESVAKCIIYAQDGDDQLLTAIANKYPRLVPDIMQEWDVEVTVTTKSN